MAKRTVSIQSRVHMHISHGLFTVCKDERDTTLPLEEIGLLILDTNQSTVTTACLSKLAGTGAEVIVCGPDHMPCGILQPLAIHCREARIMEEQLAMSKPLCKRMWSQIVKAKIENQATVLEIMGLPSKNLRTWAREVVSDDASCRESIAAREYFQLLFPDGGRREGLYASSLDYGYSIVRAAIARACAGGGWLVSHGLHHHSLYNAFNLVDDLIEPYRPLVDLLVLANDIKGVLQPEQKVLLARVLEYVMQMGDQNYSCAVCIDMMLSSMRSAVVEKNPHLLVLPKLETLELITLE